MTAPPIRLEAIGQVWESNTALCIGRSRDARVSVTDTSLSRRHAEVFPTEGGWAVRDLGSTHGTFLNGARVGRVERRLCPRDVLQCGNLVMLVSLPDPLAASPGDSVAGEWQVQGVTRHARDLSGAPGGRDVLALPDAAVDELLREGLVEAVCALGADCGAVLLADRATKQLTARAETREGPGRGGDRNPYSRTLALRCYRHGESVLCNDIRGDFELLQAPSLPQARLSSIVCALLRTSRDYLGVLQLGRRPSHPAFTLDDLHRADALAAEISANLVGVPMAEAL